MADYSALFDAGNSIVELLRKHMSPEPVSKFEHIGLCDPTEPGDYQLTLYLYHVEENGEMRRDGYVPNGANREQLAPMALKLHYLITAHSKGTPLTKAADEHKILGKALQVLRDYSVLTGDMLTGGLAESGQSLRIQFNRMNIEQLMKLWPNSGKPYKLSAAYVVEPVYIDSSRIRNITRVVDVAIDIERAGV